MKASLSYKSKRNIVISAIIVVLIALIGTGTYFFTKSNSDQAKAFSDNEMQVGETQGNEGQQGTANNEGNQGEVVEPNLNQNQDGEQNLDGSAQGNNDGETAGNEGGNTSSNTGTTTENNNGTTNNGNTSDNGTTGSTTGNVPNEDYVTERVEEQDVLVSEDYEVAWSPLTIEATTTTANLSIIRPIITAEKLVDKVAVIGGELEYTIKVINSGTADGIAIVKDTIPEGTTFVEGSIKIDGQEAINEAGEVLTQNDLENGIEIKVAKPSEEGTPETSLITFKVKVTESAEGVIVNTAQVNDQDTTEVKTPVVTYGKDVDVKEIKLDENGQLEDNRNLEYTITITNSEEVSGKAIVTDEIPTGTSFVEGTIAINGETTTKTAEELAQGIEVEVPAKTENGDGIVTLSFKVTIEDITSTIENTAYVNGQPTETEETKIEAQILFEENGGKEVEDLKGFAGEVIEETLPSTEKQGYDFAGWYSNEALTNEVTSLPEKYPAGTTIYYAKWTPRDDTKYVVNHYLENLDKTENEYTLKLSEDKQGTTGELTQATVKEYTGFTAPETVVQQTILANGTTVVDIFYTRNSYTITYKVVGDYFQNDKYEQETYKYEEVVTAIATPSEVGYDFNGWDGVPETMPAEDVEATGYYTTRNDTKYVVNHYLENLDKTENEYTLKLSEDKQGTTGELTQATVKEYTGFTAPETVEQQTILANGTTVVDIFYTRNSYKYYVEYYFESVDGKSWIHDENDDIVEDEAKYEQVITEYDEKDPKPVGYVLSHATPPENEDKNVSLKITENEETNVIKVYYVREYFDYKIEYYKKDVNGTETKLGETGKKEQKLGTKVNKAIVDEDFKDLEPSWLDYKKPTKGYQSGIVENSADNYYIEIKANDNNVIKVVYLPKTNIDYTIKYYFNGKENKDIAESQSGTATYGQKIEKEVKDYSNNGEWTLNTSKSTTLPYVIDESENLIEIYYEKPDISVKKETTPGIKEYGDTITYTITATNKGYLKGEVNIADEIPEGTIFVKDSIKINGEATTKAANELEQGITLEVPAKKQSENGTATIQFTVEVKTALPGDIIENVPTVNGKVDNSNRVTNNVEETISVQGKTESLVDCNIVLVVDTSGSMAYDSSEASDTECNRNHNHQNNGCIQVENVWYKPETRLNVAKDVIKQLIGQIGLPAAGEEGSAITIVEFAGWAETIGTATNIDEGEDLKDAVDNFVAGGGTVMSSALSKAETEIKALAKANSSNRNVVIFLSDGEPDGDYTSYIRQNAYSLKNIQNIPVTVYTIAFESDISILEDTIATDSSKYYTTSEEGSLSSIINDIRSDIAGDTNDEQSKEGLIELEGINASKVSTKYPITIIKGETSENITSLPTTETLEPTSESGKIILQGGKYYLNLKAFAPGEVIKIEYFAS